MERVSLEDVEAARARLAGEVRRTPLLELPELWLKLECLQLSGSFKVRGALNAALQLEPAARARGLVTASGGNHGLGVTAAARRLGTSARVYLPESTPADKRARLREAGAELRIVGAVWDDAAAAAQADAASSGRTWVHPFADPAVIAGNGTVALELLDELPGVRTVVIAVGGGGLLGGCAAALRGRRPDLRVVGVEPTGAPTLARSLAAGELVTLPGIETRASSLAPRRSAALNLELAREHVDEVVLVSDEEMQAAARWLWREAGVAAELGGAAGVAAVLAGRAGGPGPVCAIVCGAGTAGFEGDLAGDHEGGRGASR
ncbi:MAG: threonine/serine dehydratase [Planctomycetota bacterium]